jgi:hypothetical protein
MSCPECEYKGMQERVADYKNNGFAVCHFHAAPYRLTFTNNDDEESDVSYSEISEEEEEEEEEASAGGGGGGGGGYNIGIGRRWIARGARAVVFCADSAGGGFSNGGGDNGRLPQATRGKMLEDWLKQSLVKLQRSMGYEFLAQITLRAARGHTQRPDFVVRSLDSKS